MRGVGFAALLALVTAELICVVEVSRHGARAPSKLYPFDQAYWDQTQLSELTGVGMRQHYLLGAEFRQRYMISEPLLSPYLNISEIMVQSTDVNRTLMSAYSQMMGLFPPGTGQQLPSGKNPVPPITVFNLTNIETALGNAPLPDLWQVVPIYTRPASEDYVLRGYDSEICPRLDELEREMINSDPYQSMQNQLNMTLFKAVSAALGISVKTLKQASSLSSAIECDVAAGYKLPGTLTPSLLDELRSVHGFYRSYVPFADSEAVQLSFTAFFQELLSILDAALAGTGKKFVMFSSHDTMLSGLLAAFQFVQKYPPPFATVMVFSLYANSTISVTYNDQPVPMFNNCTGPPCPYQDFKTFLTNLQMKDYLKKCSLSNS